MSKSHFVGFLGEMLDLNDYQTLMQAEAESKQESPQAQAEDDSTPTQPSQLEPEQGEFTEAPVDA